MKKVIRNNNKDKACNILYKDKKLGRKKKRILYFNVSLFQEHNILRKCSY